MDQFHHTDMLFAITLGLCILQAMRSFYLARKVNHQKNRLQSTVKSLENASKELSALRLVEKRYNTFKDDLNKAEMFTKVHKSRPIIGQKTKGHRIPERYQYIRSLHQKGVEAPDIASILTISTHEADQLVALASLSRN